VKERDPSCADDFDHDSLTCDEALARILDQVDTVTGSERLAIRSALGRILSATLTSPVDVPAHTNSAMDGFAVRASDLATSGRAKLKVIGTAFAGKPFNAPVGPRDAVRIMTGGAMPSGTDTVIMQEHADPSDGFIEIDANHKLGQNVRAAGEDLKRGQLVLDAGHRLAPADLGLIASLGIGEVSVFRRVRVAYFSTGDELRSLGEPLGVGEIYDSNRYTLFAMLKRIDAEIIDMGVVRDTREAVQVALEEAAAVADVVVTSGGVSVGEADYIKDVLEIIGQVRFWKVAMKPGRPLAFGSIGPTRFFGLPGNPVSVMVTFYQFVQPALLKMAGARQYDPVLVTARTTGVLKKRPGRTEYQRGILSHGNNGELLVSPTGDQGSGILRSMSIADCFIILPAESARVEADSIVSVQPFHGLM
jgi:molybdopterin molybdotransferase